VVLIIIWSFSPSKAIDSHFRRSPTTVDSPDPSNWVVAYQIWSLESMELTTTKRFYLPADEVLTTRLGTNLQPQDFRFPVSLSPSLRLILIMGFIIQIEESSKSGVLEYLLFDSRCIFNALDEQMLAQSNRPRYFENQDGRGKGRDSYFYRCHKWFRCYFSPTEQYVVVIKGHRPPDSFRPHEVHVLDIYERVHHRSPEFRLLGTAGAHLNGNATHPVTFHPQQPLLAISKTRSTTLWRFWSKGQPISWKH
jgi:hypothetical protein